jgi:hypothetical protein
VLVTATVVIWKAADTWPVATVTLVGTVAADVLLLVSVTTAPPFGAAAFSVIDPVEPIPPVTLVGFNETEEITGGLTVSEVLWLPL